MTDLKRWTPYIHTDGEKWKHFFVSTKSGIIYYEAKINGKRVTFSTKVKFPDGNKARRYVNAELDRILGRKKVYTRTLIGEELNSWLTLKMTEGWKYDTLNNIKRAKKQINWFWGKKLPSEINRDSFAEWCLWWEKNHPDIKMENAIKYFNNFCTYLHEKVINDRPLLASRIRFKDPKRNEIEDERAVKKERILTYDEFLKIYKTAEDEAHALVVLFMYTMASRIDETLNLDFEGRILLDQNPPIYRWTSGSNKGRKTAEHALHKSLIEPLKALRDRRRSENTRLLFPQIKDNQKALREQMIDWEAWRTRADVGFHWTPHTFRHTCLSLLFNDEKNPQAVICKLYRTSLQVALKTYIKVTREAMMKMRDSIEIKL